MEVRPPETEAAELPLLAPGFTLSVSNYGSADLPDAGAPERVLFDDALAAGLGGFTFYVELA